MSPRLTLPRMAGLLTLVACALVLPTAESQNAFV